MAIKSAKVKVRVHEMGTDRIDTELILYRHSHAKPDR